MRTLRLPFHRRRGSVAFPVSRLTADVIFAVMSEEKANQKEQIRFPKEEIQKYFPKSYTGKDMQNTILKLLEKWQRQRERNAREER